MVHYVFVWGKGKTMDFSEIVVVCDIKVGRCSELNKYMNLYKYQRSRSFIDLGPRSLRFNIFKLSVETAGPIEAEIHMEPPWGNENTYKCFMSHDQDGRHAHIW